MNRRVILIVLDSVGAGASEDAALYGDAGANTLKHIDAAVGGLRVPVMQSLGLGNVLDAPGIPPQIPVAGAYGRMKEKSPGKDTTTGHWEMMGLLLPRAFPCFPDGFPQELIGEFERQIGRKTLGNIAASGTVIIEELGPEHLATGFPIVYTSADSVFQIAAHEDVIPLEELYRMCRIARAILTGDYGVGRVIARPFIGQPGSFTRPPRRHDFALEPPRHLLDIIVESGLKVYGVGKIHDIFAGRAVPESFSTDNNADGVNKIVTLLHNSEAGLIFANLIDFDQLYGHRNDAAGYAGALQEFDSMLPGIIAVLQSEDLLIITADHGCDPLFPGTDHTREEVPLLACAPWIKGGHDLGLRSSFADIARTIADYLGLNAAELAGQSFLAELQKEGEACERC